MVLSGCKQIGMAPRGPLRVTVGLVKDSPVTNSAQSVDLGGRRAPFLVIKPHLGSTGAAHVTKGLLVELSRFFSVDLKNEPSILTLAQGVVGPVVCGILCLQAIL